MAQLFTNNAYASLGASLNAGATSLTLATGTGSKFPTPTGGDFFLLTLVGIDSNGNENAWEIIKVTGRSSDVLTVVRGQESTTDATWSSGTRVELRLTAQTLTDLLYTPGAVIAVSGSTDALRITNTGTGKSILIEDSASPDATPFVVDADGRVITGHTASVSTQNFSGTSVSANLQVHGTGPNTSSGALFNWASTAVNTSSLIFNKSIGGTTATRGALTVSGSRLGAISFAGDDGTNFISAAAIFAETDATPGTNDMPGRLVFSTTLDGASSPTERMRIDNAGNIGIGTTPSYRLHVVGATGNVAQFINGTTNRAVNIFSAAGFAGLYDGTGGSGNGISFDTANNAVVLQTNGTGRVTVDSTGDLIFNSTSARIMGDFSNATLASRVAIQTSTTNGNTGLFLLPHGTAQISTLRVYNTADPTNGSYGQLQVNASEVSITAAASGTGTNLPLALYTGGSEAMRVLTSGNVGIGSTGPLARLHVSNSSITGGGPATSGSAADPNSQARLQASTVVTDFGAYANGDGWIQQRSSANYATNYGLGINPNGGRIFFGGGVQETRIAIPASDINLSNGNYFTRTISGTTTLTVSNVPPSGTAASFILDLTNGGSATINWWSGMKWASGTAPTLTASGRDVLGFFTHDGGTTWTGLVLGKDVK